MEVCKKMTQMDAGKALRDVCHDIFLRNSVNGIPFFTWDADLECHMTCAFM